MALTPLDIRVSTDPTDSTMTVGGYLPDNTLVHSVQIDVAGKNQDERVRRVSEASEAIYAVHRANSEA